VGLSRELRDVTAATRRNGSSLTAKASERSKNVAIFGHFVARLGEIGPPVILGNRWGRTCTRSSKSAPPKALLQKRAREVTCLKAPAHTTPQCIARIPQIGAELGGRVRGRGRGAGAHAQQQQQAAATLRTTAVRCARWQLSLRYK
jgi:hypothetical protein